MKLTFNHFNSLIILAEHFSSEKRCRDFITEQRWGKKVICPFCGGTHIYICGNGDNQFKCSSCYRRFSCLVGTIFQKTKLPLKKWFMAMYMMASHKKGISSHQLARDLSVTQKTAWFMLQKLRILFEQDYVPMLEGEIEIDELYYGGRESNKHHMKRLQQREVSKPPVFGMIQRWGNARAILVKDAEPSTLLPLIRRYCSEHAVLFTDELNTYKILRKDGFKHCIIRHSMKEFYRNGVTTNKIEGFWGNFKRMVFGTYHVVSKTYLQRYIDEAVFRYNTRGKSNSDIFKFLLCRLSGAISYQDVLISEGR